MISKQQSTNFKSICVNQSKAHILEKKSQYGTRSINQIYNAINRCTKDYYSAEQKQSLEKIGLILKTSQREFFLDPNEEEQFHKNSSNIFATAKAHFFSFDRRGIFIMKEKPIIEYLLEKVMSAKFIPDNKVKKVGEKLAEVESLKESSQKALEQAQKLTASVYE